MALASSGFSGAARLDRDGQLAAQILAVSLI